MLNRQELTARLMETFLVELQEHVGTLNGTLLALERDGGRPDPERLDALQRVLHSLKGAARSVDVRIVEAACHRAEEVVSGLRDGTIDLRPAVIELLLAVTDGLEQLQARMQGAEEATAPGLEALLPLLEQARSAGATGPAPPVVFAPASPPAPPDETARYVRLPAVKLDVLLNRSGELRMARRRLQDRQIDGDVLASDVRRVLRQWRKLRTMAVVGLADARLLSLEDRLSAVKCSVDRLRTELRADRQLLDKTAGALDDAVHEVRLQPFREACQGLDRTVRDLARTAGKDADFVVEGGDVGVDRAVLQALRNPLLHLVRNAIDHGVEEPSDRQANGKPRRGRIVVRAELKGAAVEVRVIDDGRGLMPAAVSEAARRRNLPLPVDAADVTRLIFQPGLSTAPMVTEVSGRGVGLDVVKSRIEGLGGSVEVVSRPGVGACFRLTLPLTLTRTRAVLVACTDQIFALPAVGVARILSVDERHVASVNGRAMLRIEDQPVLAVTLSSVLGASPAAHKATSGRTPHVVLTDGDQRAAFAVDALFDEQEVVVRKMGPRLRHVPFATGATVLSDGRLALILSPATLVRQAFRADHERRTAAAPSAGDVTGKRVLIVDDSVTARNLERAILEAAGHEVTVAENGVDGWRRLQEEPFDLVVADLDMPEMDGFELTRTIRGSARTSALPVIIVTGRERDADLQRALQVGADAYVRKSTFDATTLLEVVARLL